MTGTGIRDVVVVGGALALLVVLTDVPTVRGALPLTEITQVLVLVAVAGGAMAAILAHVVNRLVGDRRAAWLSVALALYSLLGIPAATLGASLARDDAAVGAARLFVHSAVVGLLLVTARGPGMRRPWSGWSLSLLGLLLTVGVATLGGLYPATTLAVTTYGPLRTGVAAAWIAFAVMIAVVGWSRRSSPLYRIGLGATVMAIAHAYRVSAGQPGVPLGLTFSAVRLLGVLIVLLGTIQLVRHALRTVDRMQAEQQEELRLAQIGLHEAAERDHELRNGLAGLAGATDLLESDPGGDDAAVLHTAVAAELARLDAMLRTPNGACPQRARHGYPVTPLLRQQVALRRCGGMDVSLDADPALRAKGSPEVLAQVVTNVLANCASHAEGSPVRIHASARRGGTIRIWISDFGPGVNDGSEQAVFGLGARGEHSDGRGLGLHISRRLLQAEGATIHIVPRRRERSGCTVVLEFPAAEPADTRSEPAALVGTS